jgi:hypothetical protein
MIWLFLKTIAGERYFPKKIFHVSIRQKNLDILFSDFRAKATELIVLVSA